MASEQYRLIIKNGPNPGRAFDLTKESMTIGREATCDIVIQEAELSRVHARISRKGGAFVIEDLGSTNGTFVKGQRLLAPRALAPGDEIGLGENVVVIYQGEGAAATVVAASAFQQAGTRQAPLPVQAPVYVAQAAAPAGAKSGGGAGKWIIGCIVLLILMCIVVVAAGFIFDYLNLYCTSPFDAIFGSLGYCIVQ